MPASASKAWILAQLSDLDQLLQSHCGQVRSLHPSRHEATTFYALGQALLPIDCEMGWCEVFAASLAEVLKSQIHHFPDNIFWDSDFLFASFASLRDPAALLLTAQTLSKLQAAYGIHSPIRFQYIHDFTYGFDWARWVAKNPESRKNASLFAPDFLSYLQGRQQEILALIAKGDAKYGPLLDSKPRNPYRFARTPEKEQKILGQMATRGFIPVPAWDIKPQVQWQHDYTRLREELACADGA